MAVVKTNIPKVLLLLTLFALGVIYLWGDLSYAYYRDRTDQSPLRSAILLIHLACATPLLLLPPFQFSRRVRARWPVWHRRAGTLYLLLAVMAAVAAIYLAVQFEEPGRRPPLFIFAVLWLFFSGAAWVSARCRKFSVHQRFVVRSYAVALGFVFVRLLGEFSDVLLPFMEPGEIRGVTREWLCFVLPLVVVEASLGWWPALRPVVAELRSPRSAG